MSVEVEQLRVKPKSKKALKHQEQRARGKRRQKAQLDARYAGIAYREQRKERIRENNQPKLKVKLTPAAPPAPEVATAEVAAGETALAEALETVAS